MMQAFSRLLDRLYYTSSKLGKTALLHDYWQSTSDPDRGWAVAAMASALKFKEFKRGLVRNLIRERVDPVLYDLCYDYVGETAETVSHLWPAPQREPARLSHQPSTTSSNTGPGKALADFANLSGRCRIYPVASAKMHQNLASTQSSNSRHEVGEISGLADAMSGLTAVIEALSTLKGTALESYVAGVLDNATASERWAFIKLATGGLRIGVSQRFLKQALADYGQIDVQAVEAIWHGLTPPYEGLFDWLEGRTERPQVRVGPTFHPVMLAHPLPPERLAEINPEDFVAEWKYDGVRVQLVATPAGAALFSRTGDSMGHTFPELLRTVQSPVVLDAELVVKPNGAWGTFADLQQRLNRKQVSARWLKDYPAHLIVYDILSEQENELIHLPLSERRLRLEQWYNEYGNELFSLSPWVEFKNVSELQALRDACGRKGRVHLEGFMFKRLDSIYVAGRPMGQWYKWKRDPFLIDAVVMYAQRGHGKRSSLYSDYTFGLWHDGALLPVGKAYFGFTDEELLKLDKWVRDHTLSRFGPVREVEQGLVLEIAFDSVHASSRHKSGVALRFPRVHRIRWDKPHQDADVLGTLKAFIIQPTPAAQLELFD